MSYQDLLLQNLNNPKFRDVFTEWYENYYNPHPYPPSDSYLKNIEKYVLLLTTFFPKDQKSYWESFFRDAMLRLSKDDASHTSSITSTSTIEGVTFEPQEIQQYLHQLLHESSFSPLLTIQEQILDGIRHTYLVSYKTIELCRIGVGYGDEKGWSIVSTWRTQEIPDDPTREYVLILIGEIFKGLLPLMNQMAERQTSPQYKSILTLAQFNELLRKQFDESELKDVCLALQVDYESLPGNSKADKSRELILYLQRRGRVPELLTLVKQERPHIPWPDTIQ